MEKTMKKTDEQLIELFAQGDAQAMDELLLRYAGLVRGRARGFFLYGGETEDLIQEGMIGLHRAILDYKRTENGKSFKNFAYMCVSRKIIDAVKKSASKKNQPLNNSIPDSVLDGRDFQTPSLDDEIILSDEKKEFKQKMIRILSDFEYKIFSLYMDGMSCSEICETTGKSVKSVDNAIQRSKKKLQRLVLKTGETDQR